ncbi:diacylglycerol/lipid kinase family protein [Paludibaculum fermentans]|uniref:DAGKc domain-containing protein n=1 Tax=Paludibaculum fermentans TaxID=1473598 RepID=A0A7S7SLC2_PALFE|nr:diacylglycerol kinase family protein [Paludibaculum fermentans]QOY88281.1 hypothetical protein IRI77_37050 [Paludibaculum fermentans]
MASLVYNPVAGKLFRRPQMIAEAQRLLEPHVGTIRLCPTTGPDTAGPIARKAIDEGSNLVFVAGGDGTINEVIAGMAGLQVPLGILPAGTANVLGMETGIGGNLVRAATRFQDLEPATISLGRMTAPGKPARYFACMAGVGLDARIVRMVSPEFKRRWGKLSYWEGGFAQVGKKLPEFDVVMDGKRSRCSFALVSRVRNYGGDLEIARHANLLSDQFAVVLFEGPSSFRYLKYFSGVLFNSLKGMKGVTVAHARSLQLEANGSTPIDVQVDGEYAGVAPVSLDIAPERVRLLLPRGFIQKMSSGR